MRQRIHSRRWTGLTECVWLPPVLGEMCVERRQADGKVCGSMDCSEQHFLAEVGDFQTSMQDAAKRTRRQGWRGSSLVPVVFSSVSAEKASLAPSCRKLFPRARVEKGPLCLVHFFCPEPFLRHHNSVSPVL